MGRVNKDMIRSYAFDILNFYTARVRITNTAVVRRGKMEHKEPGLKPTPGWWIDCQVFVARDEMGGN